MKKNALNENFKYEAPDVQVFELVTKACILVGSTEDVIDEDLP